MDTTTRLTDPQISYLGTQWLGRLATVDRRGAPQNNPVGFRYNADLGTIDIGGFRLAESRKFRNLAGNDRAAFVVDDLVSTDPWRPRMVEIRGRAEALSGAEPMMPGMSSELIRIHPERVISFGLEEEGPSAGE